MKQIVLASNNQGKLKEFGEIFSALGIEVIAQSELNVPEVDEPYFTFVENIRRVTVVNLLDYRH